MQGRNDSLFMASRPTGLALFFLILTHFSACHAPGTRPKIAPRPPQSETSPTEPLAPNQVILARDENVDPKTGELKEVLSTKDTLEPLWLVMAPKVEECSVPVKPRSRPSLRRLIKEEYQNTLRDLFAVSKDYGNSLPPDAMMKGFRNLSAPNGISSDRMQTYFANAKEIAQEVLPKLKTLIGCEAAAGGSCANTFIDTMGPKIWRRPILPEERTALQNAWKTGAAVSPNEGMLVLMRVMLGSTHFLYRSELGPELNAYEIASALSYFFWASTPDDTLLKLASTGELLKDSIIVEQAKRLLADSRAKAGIDLFFEAYSGYKGVFDGSKDATKYPNFNDEMRVMLARESIDTFDHFLRVKNSKFSELFSWDQTVGDPKLAAFYGVPASTIDGVSYLDHKSTPRRGVLGLASVLASLGSSSDTHPVKRGEFIVEHLLCDKLMPTPDGLQVVFPAPDPNLTTRERFAMHSSNSFCAGCHLKLDNAGFGMEDYDTIGLPRSLEGEKKIDATGVIFNIDGKKELPFSGVDELGKIMASSVRAQQCLALQVYQFAQGRLLVKPVASDPSFQEDKALLIADVCTVRELAQDFVKKDGSIVDLFIKIIQGSIHQTRGE